MERFTSFHALVIFMKYLLHLVNISVAAAQVQGPTLRTRLHNKGMQMISPLSQTGINPLRQAQSPSLLGPQGSQTPGAVSPLGDLSSLSPESQGQDGDISQMMQALMQAFGGQQQQQTPIPKGQISNIILF